MTSYFEHSKLTKLDYILDCLDESDVALVSDAGTPGLNDPGYDLIVAAAKRGITVTPIPGPSVVVAALVVSGLPTDRFTYLGFLPRKAGDRRRFLKSAVDESATLVILETPHRLKEALTDISDILGDRRIAVCRELTKLHEEIFRGTVSGAIAHFTAPRGEFALVIDGKREITTPALTDDITGRLQNMRRSGMTAKEAIAGVSKETGLPRKKLYQVWLTLSPSPDKKIDK
jgi:16S rRNA (cytidine1402-2'-O)-methyltransferase